MSDTTGAVDLPAENKTALADAYAAYKQADAERSNKKREAAGVHLARLITAGRKAGWTGRVMAESAGGVTPERLWQIVKKYDDGKPVKRGTPKYPVLEKPKPKPAPKTKRSHLSKREAKRLYDLGVKASKNTGSRPLNSPYRKASEDFSALIIELHDRGVIWDEIANAAGYTAVGVRMRAARHGHGKGAPPSIQPYRRVVVEHPKKNVDNPDDSKGSDSKKEPSKGKKAKAKSA